MQLQRVEDAITAIKNGEMIIIMDDEGRENEGDIVYAGEFSTPQKVNFLITEARGVLCVSLTNDIAKKLDFPLMVDKNSSNHETAFTVSVDAKRAKTGVSAFERDLTIKLICNDSSTPNDFAKPGHIFPLIAKNGGVLVRTGHTEASVDICTLAGVKPIAVICELMKNDGTMANNNDNFVLEFAKKHNLKILYVSDLVHYKFQYEVLVSKIGEESVRLCGIACKKHTFIDHTDSTQIVYEFPRNDDANAVSVRFHSFDNALHLLENEAFEILQKSIDFLQKNGGFLVCLSGDNSGVKNLSESSKVVGIGAQILKSLKISEFNLLSTRKNHQYIALNGFGLTIKDEILI